MPGGGAGLTWSEAVPETPLGAAAVMVASPVATAVATPVALTVATSGALLDQVKTTPAIGWLALSNAEAVKVWAPPATAVDEAGATVTVATSAGGGGGPLSLQAPKVLAIG